MTREEAITYLKVIWNRYKAEYEIERETLDAYNMAIEALQTKGVGRYENAMQKLREMPRYLSGVKEKRKAEPKTGEWIPCSERLPNKKDLYMVTLKTFSDDYRFIDLLYYGKPLMPNCRAKGVCWYRSDSEWGDVVYDDTDILAWMPLPEPYKGGDTE